MLLCCFLLYCMFVAKIPPRAALPGTATEVNIFRSDYAGVTMDYFWLVKAKVTEDEFREYVATLGLVPYDGVQHLGEWPRYHWGGHGDCKGAWWDPTESMANTYHDSTMSGSACVLAKYENGYVYCKESMGY